MVARTPASLSCTPTFFQLFTPLCMAIERAWAWSLTSPSFFLFPWRPLPPYSFPSIAFSSMHARFNSSTCEAPRLFECTRARPTPGTRVAAASFADADAGRGRIVFTGQSRAAALRLHRSYLLRVNETKPLMCSSVRVCCRSTARAARSVTCLAMPAT